MVLQGDRQTYGGPTSDKEDRTRPNDIYLLGAAVSLGGLVLRNLGALGERGL